MIILQSHERMHTGLLGNVKVKKKDEQTFPSTGQGTDEGRTKPKNMICFHIS